MTAPKLLILIILLAAPLTAELSSENDRWARRALLDRDVRQTLNVEIGESSRLDTVLSAPAELDGLAGQVVLLRRGEIVVVAVLRGMDCVAHCGFTADGELELTTRTLAGQGWILVDEASGDENFRSTRRRLIGLRANELAVRQSWNQHALRQVGKRFRREQTAELQAEGGSLLLTTRVRDLLDGKLLEGGESEHVLRLTPQADGSLRPEIQRDRPVAIAVKLRHARILERERLDEAALLIATEAADQSARLPADDARRLDAAGLLARLQARNKQVEATERR